MFLPLLQMVDGNEEVTSEGLGNLSFLIEGLSYLGINLTINSILFVILFFFTLKGIFKFIESYNKVLTQQYFIKKLRFNNVSKLNNFSYKSFVMADSGRIQNTLSGEVGRVVRAYQAYFMTVQAGIMVFVYVVMAYLTNPQFAILVTLGGGLSNLVFRQIYKKTKETSRKISNAGHKFQGLLIQNVAFFKYLKATGLSPVFAKKLKQAVITIENNNKKIGFYNSILSATREPLVIAVVVAVITIQITYFSESLGLIILSLLFFYRSLTFLMVLQTQWNNFLNVSGSLENMTEFMQELSAHQDKLGGEKIKAFNKSLEIKGGGFKYGEASILRNINLHIDRNQTIAFVGESGSGKTTLVNLLSGLIPLSDGSFLIDSKPSSEIDISSFQKRIGYITQEPVIFSDSIYNNVTFWAEDNPENKARFWEALHKAAIADFIQDLPNKENSMLGNNGILISGGQKQRLSIARELYKDIDILIMDEATSALDSETEKVIQENIDSLKGKYTILIVAHRLATVKNADQIVLLENGEISAIGDFVSLTSKSENFKRMVSLQEV
ncbi:ATP-binding cassette, subfamily B, MsbA [Pontibacter lucknowensis]|uniref:ATP-binding cassette, subfamily B, MsbA n=2 Tax=Pontibacter lucknowensis TaxID=1077936 RepID=A0A1N6Y710_9BACT|nr:ATP-binding cassette, subfamily B, MsbA [Pontibacter lucknowensis]